MKAVGLKVLKNKLSEYVRAAHQGETILVTDRGEVVAELIPPRGGRSIFAQDGLLAEAVRKGWLTPPLYKGKALAERRPVGTLKEILERLEADRSER